MAERLIHTLAKKTPLTPHQRKDAIALTAAYLDVPTDRIVIRDVSAMVVLARGIVCRGLHAGDWDEGVVDADYGYEIVVIDE